MEKPLKPFFVYLLLVSGLGISLIVWSATQLPTFVPILHFILPLLLAVIGQVVTTSVAVSEDAGITYQVTPAAAISTLPFFGPAAAILIEAAAAIALWLVKPSDKITWKKNWSQLSFNIGMNSIAMFGAGSVFVAMRGWLGEDSLAGAILPWPAAAIVNDQLNLWLLTGILYLQHERQISPIAVWRQNLWAMPISILLMALGGGLMAFALQDFGWVGMAIFFIPVLLSAYAFRLYVRQIQGHMERLELMVEERTAQLEASVRRKDALLAVLTHDMITPLTSTHLYAELLRDDPLMAAKNPDLIDNMLHSQQTLLNMAKNVLDIERLQSAGNLPMHRTEFDLGQVMAYTIGLLTVQAKEKGVELGYDMQMVPMVIRADQQQIERVLLNLITNAVKYTPSGGRVNASARLEDRHVVIDVTDNGYGIPTEELSQIFDRFSRVEQLIDKATGTGLGLAISKVLVENHDGAILVESKEGEGSTFTVRLPIG